MNDQVKFIVERLNREPFKKNLNFIQFDSLSGNNLLQLLNDIFTEIEPKQKADVKNEEADHTAIRMMNFLRVLKYRPQNDENLTNFRQGIVVGDKNVIYPIMKWCLDKLHELKKRAYLANFLVKINIPSDYMSDMQINELYTQYEGLIDDFKETHKHYETLASTQHTTDDLRKDIENMENEKEQIAKRLDRVKKKVERLNNTSSMLELSRMYRLEIDREQKIVQQKADLHTTNVQLEQKIDRHERTLKDLQNAYQDLNADTIIQKMEEENKVNAYMVNQKYPKEIETYKQKVADYESIISRTAFDPNDLTDLRKRIEDVYQEIQQLIKNRDSTRDPIDDKLTMFRQQATIIARKREACAETLNELRTEYGQYEKDLKQKRSGGGEDGVGGVDEDMLKPEDFKRYVNKLRSKGTTYKMKRQEITDLQAEYATLKRTEEILRKKYDSIKGQLTAEERASLDDGEHRRAGGAVNPDEALSKKELKERISKKKAELSPIVKELKTLREVCEEIRVEYETKKFKYDQINAGYEGNRSGLEQDVVALSNEFRSSEERYHKLNSQKLISLAFQKRGQDEFKTYTTKNSSEKSFRDQLNKRINEQESLNKTLKDKQKSLKDVSIDGTKQTKLWRDLLRQMELKRKISLGLSLDDLTAYKNTLSSEF